MAFRIPGETVQEGRFRMRMDHARMAQEEEDRKHSEQIAFQLWKRQMHDENQRWKERFRYELYVVAGMILDRMAEERERNAPHGAEEEWSERFCASLRGMQDARMVLDEMRP